MSTFISEPGTRLGGRYRLEDRVATDAGWSLWKAIDETLARPVTVLTFAPGFPRIREVVTAARAASRLTDPRVTQVFDVEEDWDHAYVVMEWVAGDSLADLVADGPLDPGEAARIIAEAAEALASAHAAGLAHLRLSPSSLRWTQGGGVKVTGIGVDAALAGAASDDPARADAVGLGQLLYVALTACAPGPDWPGLPPAPLAEGRPCAPRQVRAGVPAALDEVVRQALVESGPEAVTTPASLAAALTRIYPARVGPPPAAPAPGRGYGALPPGQGEEGGRGGYWQDGPPGRAGAPAGRPRATRVMLSVVAVLVLAVAGIGAVMLDHHGGGGGAQGKSELPNTRPSVQPSSASNVLAPVSAHGFDPLSPASSDPGDENNNMAHYAIDSNPKTAWQTQYYLGNPRFGGLKSGTGLILDMGRPVRLSSVVVTFGPTPGANVRIELGGSDLRAPSTLKTFTPVARGYNVAGTTTFTVHSSKTGRYVLIWFTKLPPKQGSSNPPRFMGEIFNVVVRGSS